MNNTHLKLNCCRCGVDVKKLKETAFMLRDTLWECITVNTNIRLLCLSCIEENIQRKLDYSDFELLSVNDPDFGQKSDKLLDRVKGFKEHCLIAANRSHKELQLTFKNRIHVGKRP